MVTTIQSSPTHVAYADESRHNQGRYRSVALVSLLVEDLHDVTSRLDAIAGSAPELKWQKIQSASERAVAVRVLLHTIDEAVRGTLRVDVLTWDTQDRRHKIQGRDDAANLERMYRFLLDAVLRRRWPPTSVWRLCPDENTAIDWDRVEALIHRRFYHQPRTVPEVRLGLSREFGIEALQPCRSHNERLIQIADLFAGLGNYSFAKHMEYATWRHGRFGQLSLGFGGDSEIRLSRSELERFPVLSAVENACARTGLVVREKQTTGLSTPILRANQRINFWFYRSVRLEDRAPIRRR